MNQHDGAGPPAMWLHHLHQAGDWTRLIEMAGRSLASAPNDPDTHRHIAWAYAKTGRLDDLKRHVDFLLQAEPGEARNHHLAAIHCLDTGQNERARRHVEMMLRKEPNSATYHYVACIQALRCRRNGDAREHINRARALAPRWAAAAHLEIQMDGAGRKKAREAWARITRLKGALALDPRDADVMTSIGDILLTPLEMPRMAEGYYREALRIDPHDRNRQRKLLNSIRARSLLYRTLSLPSAAVQAMSKLPNLDGLRWVLLILMVKLVMVFVAWLVVIGLFFTPAAWVYEWLVLADITRMQAQPRILAPLRAALKWPLFLRMSVALITIAAAWLLVLWRICGVAPVLACQCMAATFGIHFAAVAGVVGCRKLGSLFGQWQEWRRLRREARAVQPGAA